MAGTLSMCFLGGAALVGAGDSEPDATLWTFANPSDRLAPVSGTATLEFFNPDATGWGPRNTSFGTASSLGLPGMTGGDAHVMRFPASTARQGYVLTHGAPPNGPFGETDGLVSNYSLIVDVLYPSASDGRWRALQQTNAARCRRRMPAPEELMRSVSRLLST
jgi:5'-nucleotidase/UDP-sugar diphosphatase